MDIQPQEANEILNKLKTEIGISFERSDQYFLISGSLSQINECQVLIHKYLNQEENISIKLSKFSLDDEDVKTGRKEAKTSTATQSLNDASTGVIIAKPVTENPSGKVLYINDLEQDDAEGFRRPMVAEKQTYQAKSLAISFMKQFFAEQIQIIAGECLVEFVKMNGDTLVTLQPKTEGDPTRYVEACGEFLMLLNTASQGMTTWELHLKGVDNDSDASLIQYLLAKYPVIVEQPQGKDSFVVYGDAASVEQVKLTIEGGMSELDTGDVPTGTLEMEKVESGSISIETYSHCTERGVNISLRYGDITGENVDAIVNPANDYLLHGAGLAKLISEKGGRVIKTESERVIAKRWYKPLNIGDAVHTKAGNLPCKFVIHAVGPEWGKQSEKKTLGLLQRACVESLKLASKLGLSSVALPAISSGVYRTPIDVCAFAMLNGVQEYLEYLKKAADLPKKGAAKKKVPKGNSQRREEDKKAAQKKEDQTTTHATESGEDQGKAGLVDIRFVLIDADAMDVFEKEFIKRFSIGQKHPGEDDDYV